MFQVRSRHSMTPIANGFDSKEHGDKFIREHLGDRYLMLYESVPDTDRGRSSPPATLAAC